MTVSSKIKSHSDVIDYNKPIKKPEVKCLKNIDQLIELAFYKQVHVKKNRSSIYSLCNAI